MALDWGWPVLVVMFAYLKFFCERAIDTTNETHHPAFGIGLDDGRVSFDHGVQNGVP